MSSLLHDPEQWLNDFEAASAKQQYDLVMQAIAEPIPASIAEEIDLGMTLVEMRDQLVGQNQVELAIVLTQQLQQQQPALYQKEFQYFDDFWVQYYLYQNDLQQVESALTRFMANPAQGIDQMLETLDYLAFYNASDLAATLCRATYQPVKASPNVLSGVEIDLAEIVLMRSVEQAYQQLQQGELIDWEALASEIVQIDFDREPLLTDLRHALETEFQANQTFLKDFKNDRGRVLFLLSINFSKHMAEHKQMGFICSQAIWQSVIEFLEQQERPKKDLSHSDGYFTFQQKALDRYVAQQIGGFLSLRQAVGFGILWGLPYIYDFLLSRQLIQSQMQQQAIAISTELKTQLIQGFEHSLWRYDFVHRWSPPDSIDPAEFATEAEQFAASLQQVIPLSEEPGAGTFNSQLQQWAEEQGWPTMSMLPPEQDEDEDEELPIISRPVQPPPSKWKAPKPRKSSLHEAGELPERKQKPSSSKSSGKKTPKKGFGSKP